MAAYSQLSVINLALLQIPNAQIVSLSERSKAADTMRAVWSLALGLCLEATSWGFAKKRQALAVQATNPREGSWLVRYAMPSDMVFPVRLLQSVDSVTGSGTWAPQVGQTLPAYPNSPEDPGYPYDLEGGDLYANLQNGILEYVQADPSIDLFSPTFIMALMMTLDALACLAITSDAKKAADFTALASNARDVAAASSMNRQRQTYGNFVPEEVAARLGLDPQFATLPWVL